MRSCCTCQYPSATEHGVLVGTGWDVLKGLSIPPEIKGHGLLPICTTDGQLGSSLVGYHKSSIDNNWLGVRLDEESAIDEQRSHNNRALEDDVH